MESVCFICSRPEMGTLKDIAASESQNGQYRRKRFDRYIIDIDYHVVLSSMWFNF
jgi:hypothetical protein